MNILTTFFTKTVPFSFYVCIGLITGILFALYFQTSTLLLISAALLASSLTIYHKSIISHKQFYLICGAFIFGTFRMQSYLSHFHSFDYSLIPPNISAEGTISNICHNASSRTKKCISVVIESCAHSSLLNTTIQLHTNPCQEFNIGDYIRVNNLKLRPSSNQSYQHFLFKMGALCSCFIDGKELTLIDRPSWCIQRYFYLFREKILANIKHKCSWATFSLFSALFLGEKTHNKQYLERMSQQFNEWGIVHFLARSGLHLVIFIILWELIFSFIPCHYVTKQVWLIMLTLTYFILSWPSVSFLRALFSFLQYKWCTLFLRPTHFLHTLLTTCCIILTINPMQLFFLDFQLTFILTGALAWLSLESRTH